MQPDAEHFADIVASAIRVSMAPLLSRISALEAAARDVQTKSVDPVAFSEVVAVEVAKLPPGPAGKDADPEHTAALVDAAVTKALALISVPRDGTDGAPGEIGPQGPPGKDADETKLLAIKSEMASLREEWMTKAAELHPAELPDIPALVVMEINRAVADLPRSKDGEPGRSVEPSEVEAMVVKAVEALPKPQDGRSVTLEDLGPLVHTVVTKVVDALPRAKDGIGIVNALVDREGHLVQTFSDGSTKDVGVVVGRDADPVEMARVIAEEVAKIPRPKDGRDGKITDAVKMVKRDERTHVLCFKDGTTIEGGEITFEHPLDKGVWRPDQTYVKGDGVTFGGSFFIAQQDDPGKPEVGNGWRLAVKRGRDGMNGKNTQTVAPVVKTSVK